MNPKTLKPEEKENLRDLVTSDGYRALMKVLDKLLMDRQAALTNYDLINGTERLFSLKAEYDGAKKFLAAFKTSIASLKK